MSNEESQRREAINKDSNGNAGHQIRYGESFHRVNTRLNAASELPNIKVAQWK